MKNKKQILLDEIYELMRDVPTNELEGAIDEGVDMLVGKNECGMLENMKIMKEMKEIIIQRRKVEDQQLELAHIVHCMSIQPDEVRNNIYFLGRHTKGPVIDLVYIYNYGYMMGVRAERERHRIAI